MKRVFCTLLIMLFSIGLFGDSLAVEAEVPIVIEEFPLPDNPIYVLGLPIKEAYYMDEDEWLFLPYLAVAEKLGYEHDDFVIGEEENTLTLIKPSVEEEGLPEHTVTLIFTVDGYGYVPSIFTTIDGEELEILDSGIAIEGQFFMTLDVFSMLFNVFASYDETTDSVTVLDGNPLTCYLGGADLSCGSKFGIDGCSPLCPQECEECTGECFVLPNELADEPEIMATATPIVDD